MLLYSSHHDSSVSDIGALRWFLFSKQNYTGYRLPPTWGALKYHILRANFVACMWHLSLMSFNPVIPSPADSGWVLSEGTLSAHMTDNLPAPLATIEMSVCKCDKSKCVRGNCRCYRNRIKCLAMCGCQHRENTDEFLSKQDTITDFYFLTVQWF